MKQIETLNCHVIEENEASAIYKDKLFSLIKCTNEESDLSKSELFYFIYTSFY